MNHYSIIHKIAEYAINYWKQIGIVQINVFSIIRYKNTTTTSSTGIVNIKYLTYIILGMYYE